jgi:hypothetical protein
MKSNFKKWFSRSLSVVLAVLIAFQVAPSRTTALDVPVEQPPQTSITPPTLPEDDTPPPQIVSEETDLREANTKHFRNADGSFVAAVYPQAVHYKDRNGEWQEIDNTLIDNGDFYEPKASGAELSLPKTLGDGQEITLGGEGYSLGIGIDAASDEAIVLKENTQNIENQEATSIENLASGIYYPNAFENADLQYIIEPDKLKENVIVREKQDEYVYNFTLNLNGLTAAPQKDGTILLKDAASGTLKYTIDAPIAYDANGVSATDVLSISLAENVLTLTADAAWMNDESRGFPVVLDPTYMHETDAKYLKETTISSTYGQLPNVQFQLSAGKRDALKDEKMRSYIRFDLPDLPNCGVVTSAGIALDDVEYHGSGAIGAYEVTGTWSEAAMLWSKQPSHNPTVLDFEEIGYHQGGFSFDVTESVKRWYENGVQNNGIMLASLDESQNGYVTFASLSASFLIPLFLTNGEISENRRAGRFAKRGIDGGEEVWIGERGGNVGTHALLWRILIVPNLEIVIIKNQICILVLKII